MLYKLQSGFRQFFSTGTSPTFLLDYICSENDFGNFIDMVMIDLQKTFDTADHSILRNNYLTNRMQLTDVGGIFPDPRVLPCGVPQGSILRPLFFIHICQ